MQKKMIFIVLAIIFAGFMMISIKEKEYFIEKNFSSGTQELNNPARGFYRQLGTNNIEQLQEIKEEHNRLVLAAFDIWEYRACSIPVQKLQELEDFLAEADKLSLQVIFRAAYGFVQKESNDADSMDRIEEHILQIAPILNQYKRVVYCVQAGFLGPWGEWHSSIFLEGLTGQEQAENRNRILALLLAQLDSSVILNVRRPRFIRDAKKAGLATERIGYHNDGLLASEDDLGTYDDKEYDREAELLWLNRRFCSINGGEMPLCSSFTEPGAAVQEFGNIHLSYLNAGYNTEVFLDWKEKSVNGQNAYEYIKNHLGYRLFVSKISYRETWGKGNLNIEIENEGFAAVPDRYRAELILRNENRLAKQIELEVGKLQRLQYGMTAVFKINVPKDFLGSSFSIELKLYDILDDRNRIELSNQENEYKNGVNRIMEIGERRA